MTVRFLTKKKLFLKITHIFYPVIDVSFLFTDLVFDYKERLQ